MFSYNRTSLNTLLRLTKYKNSNKIPYESSLKVFGHGFLTKDGLKMGKSLGNVLEPEKLVGAYGADAVRLYFMSMIPFGSDGDFSEARFRDEVNARLANDVGNLLNRSLNLLGKNAEGESRRGGGGSVSVPVAIPSQSTPNALCPTTHFLSLTLSLLSRIRVLPFLIIYNPLSQSAPVPSPQRHGPRGRRRHPPRAPPTATRRPERAARRRRFRIHAPRASPRPRV